MATTTDVLRRDFRIGGVLAESFTVYLRQFVPFTVLALVMTLPWALVATLPGAVVDYGAIEARTDTSSIEVTFYGPSLWWGIAIEVGGWILYGLLQGAVCYGTFQHLRGQPVPIDEVVRRGIGLILPALIIYTMYWVAVPVMAVERPGVIASLNRSEALTRGHRWRVFGILVMIMILSFVLHAIVRAVMDPAAGIGPRIIGPWIVATLVYPFGAVIGPVSYYHLRAVNEGTDVEAIARIFD